MQGRMSTRDLVLLSMISALAYLAVFISHAAHLVLIPAVNFLYYDPKDVLIVIAGFLFNPVYAMIISIVVSFIEMITISSTGWIGLLMNIVSTCSFVCTASFIYQRKRSAAGAVIGLIAGCLFATAVMLLWNYFITPLYLPISREAIAKMLIPAFLPFNLIKGGLNAAITMPIYKPISNALRKQKMLPTPANAGTGSSKINISIIIFSGFIIVTCIMFVLVIKGLIFAS